jgi:hypothetical protein
MELLWDVYELLPAVAKQHFLTGGRIAACSLELGDCDLMSDTRSGRAGSESKSLKRDHPWAT